MSIQYAFVVYMFGLPTRINQTSLSEEPIISIVLKKCSYKGACDPPFASSCLHHYDDYISAKKISFPLSLFAMNREIFYTFMT